MNQSFCQLQQLQAAIKDTTASILMNKKKGNSNLRLAEELCCKLLTKSCVVFRMGLDANDKCRMFAPVMLVSFSQTAD